MTKKEKMDLFLGKLPEEKREDFLKDIRSCKTKKETIELLKKYGVAFSEEEAKMLHEGMEKEVSAEDMKNVAGGDGDWQDLPDPPAQRKPSGGCTRGATCPNCGSTNTFGVDHEFVCLHCLHEFTA